MNKSERQEISCNKWRDAKGRGTLNLIMRFGKTRVAAMIVGKLVKANPNRTIILLIILLNFVQKNNGLI